MATGNDSLGEQMKKLLIGFILLIFINFCYVLYIEHLEREIAILHIQVANQGERIEQLLKMVNTTDDSLGQLAEATQKNSKSIIAIVDAMERKRK